MSVHQVDEYYLHIDIEESSKLFINLAVAYMIENQLNYEVIESHSITVDDIYDEASAEMIDCDLRDILAGRLI